MVVYHVSHLICHAEYTYDIHSMHACNWSTTSKCDPVLVYRTSTPGVSCKSKPFPSSQSRFYREQFFAKIRNLRKNSCKEVRTNSKTLRSSGWPITFANWTSGYAEVMGQMTFAKSRHPLIYLSIKSSMTRRTLRQDMQYT